MHSYPMKSVPGVPTLTTTNAPPEGDGLHTQYQLPLIYPIVGNSCRGLRINKLTNQVLEISAQSKRGDFPQLLWLAFEGLNETSEAETDTLHAPRFGGGGRSFTSQTLTQTRQAAGNVGEKVVRTHIGKTIGHHGEDRSMLSYRHEIVVAHYRLDKRG